MTTPPPQTSDYLDTVRQLLAEDQRHADALEAGRRAGEARLAEALAAQRRVNDRVTALSERVRRLESQVNSTVFRAGSADLASDGEVGMLPQTGESVDALERTIEAVEKDLLTLRSALDWLDRNPVAPQSVSPTALASTHSDRPITPAATALAGDDAPSVSARRRVVLVALIALVLAIVAIAYVVL